LINSSGTVSVDNNWIQAGQSLGVSLGTYGPVGSSPNTSYIKSNITNVELSGTDSLIFRTNGGTEAARITSAGRLGLGTSTPSSIIEVYSSDALVKNQVGTNNSANPGIQVQHGGTINGSWRHDGRLEIGGQDSNAKIRLNPDGTVGIGTTSVSNGILHVKSNGTGSQNGLAVEASANDSFLSVYNNGSAHLLNATYSSTGSYQPIAFLTGGSERGRWDTSGRFLVGTSSSASSNSKLQVHGDSNQLAELLMAAGNADGPALYLSKSRGSLGSPTEVSSDDTLGSLIFQGYDGATWQNAAYIQAFADGTWTDGGDTSDNPSRLVFSTTADGASSPTERFKILSSGVKAFTNGALNIADTAISSGAGTNALRYSTSSGNVTYDTSTRLLKENIVDCSYGIDAVKLLKPRKYTRLDSNSEEVGFVADEVLDVIPEVVPFGPKSAITKNQEDTEDIPIAVNYDRLTAVLTKALQEAIAKIETLEAKVAALEGA
jgi:hypothetical protein